MWVLPPTRLARRRPYLRRIPKLLKEDVMPNASKQTASESVIVNGIEVHLENFDGGFTVCFESYTADADVAPMFRGLTDDRCQFPRWGYVVQGRIGFRFADRVETYQAGDAYYVPPGHTPIHHAGAEIVEFSRTEQLGQAVGVADLMAQVAR
jgi:hypothetical protein